MKTRLVIEAVAGIGIAVWAACGTSAGEDLRPSFGRAVAREICAVEFPIVAADSSVIGVASIEYDEERVLAAWGEEQVYDDVYPNDTRYHWREMSGARNHKSFRCGDIRGVRLAKRSDGRRSWHVFERGMLFGVVLDHGDEQTACDVLQQLLEWEGKRGRGLVVRPDVQQLISGSWVKAEGYQAGIAFEYYQTESDTVELRVRFAPYEVLYGVENVMVSFGHEAAKENVPIRVDKPRDGFWPWANEAPEFFKVFLADTVNASQWFRISYARGKGSYTFSLEVTPSDVDGRNGIEQSLWFHSTAAGYMRGRVPLCNQDDLPPPKQFAP